MQFLKLKKYLKDFIVFNLNDIRKIEANFDLRRLNEWQNKKYIKLIRRGYYIFSDLELNESVLFLIANKIYSPSYVSLEMALSYYNLIPESVYGITSVTSQKPKVFKNFLGEFIYRHVKPELMFGYKLVGYKNHNYKIAEIEKALLDYFYLNSHLNNEKDFFELRFNKDEFTSIADEDKLANYLEVFSNRSVDRRMKKFLKYIRND
jgi:predicted transcriptional regulator of viral defense system